MRRGVIDQPGRRPLRAGAGLSGALWTPEDLGTDAIWFVALTDHITLNGADVSAWVSVDGLHTASQATEALQPPYNATDGDLGGQPSVEFVGSEYLTIPDHADFRITTDRTLFAVHWAAAGASNDYLVAKRNGTTEWAMWADSSEQMRATIANSAQTANATAVVTTPLIADSSIRVGEMRVDFSADTVYGSVDGGTEVSATTTGGVATGTEVIAIGARNGGASPLTGKIAEFLWCKRDLTASERASYSGYLERTYGKTVAL